MTERETILQAYAERGINACSGKGGFFVEDRGFVSLTAARKETGVYMVKTRTPRESVSAYGDLAWIAAINGGR